MIDDRQRALILAASILDTHDPDVESDLHLLAVELLMAQAQIDAVDRLLGGGGGGGGNPYPPITTKFIQ